MSKPDQRGAEVERAIAELRAQLATGDPGRGQLLEGAVVASASGITIADARQPDMPLIYANPAFTRITGYTAAESIGRNCRFLHSDDRDQPGLTEVRRAIREGRESLAILRNRRSDGTVFWNELYLAPIRDGEGSLTHFIGIQNDVTARVQLEEAKDLFLQVASHDLRSPLHAILLAAAAFPTLALPGAIVSEDLHRVLATIAARAREMQRIIDDYLDLQMLEAGGMNFTSAAVDLDQMIRRVVASTADSAANKQIEILHDCHSKPPAVLADEQKIFQVAQNLISNAVKFSPPGSRVTVRIIQEGHRARVEVSDEGPGLTQEDLRRVFGKFARLSAKPTAGEKSSGLGLHICSRLMEMQGGQIGVFNNPDLGATFWISLPLA